MDFVRKKFLVFFILVLFVFCFGFIGGLFFGYCLYFIVILNVLFFELIDIRLSISKVVYGLIKCFDVLFLVFCEFCVGIVVN